MPASVSVPAGLTTAAFTVSTSTVTASTSVGITAAAGGATRTAPSALVPPPAPALTAPSLLAPANDARWAPGTSRTSDWSDASGATGCTLQVSTSSAFTTVQLERVVTASQLTHSFATEGTRSWRVRASDSSGTPGPWSVTRSFGVRS